MRACRADGLGEVPLADALRVAHDGTPVIVERALQELGFFDPIVDLYLQGVVEVASARAADELRQIGLSRLHEVCTPPEVAAMIEKLDAPAKAFAIPLSRAITAATAPRARDRYFVSMRAFVRAQIPYRLLDDYPDLRNSGHLGGHLVPVGLHQDFALTHPRYTLSVWSAVGPVQAGNSMEIHTAANDAPVIPVLEPGDVLLFQSDLPHASVPNDTDETRVSIGTRVVLGSRLHYGPGNHWRPYANARLLDTPFASLATLESRLTIAAARRWRFRRRWEREHRDSVGAASTPSLKR